MEKLLQNNFTIQIQENFQTKTHLFGGGSCYALHILNGCTTQTSLAGVKLS